MVELKEYIKFDEGDDQESSRKAWMTKARRRDEPSSVFRSRHYFQVRWVGASFRIMGAMATRTPI